MSGEAHAGTLVLAHASASPARVRQLLDRGEGPARCLFLAQDYRRLLEWRTGLGATAELVRTGPMLGRTAEELRGPFLDAITQLGRRHDSVAWWASRLSERNTMVSPLFLYCCYLKLAQDSLGGVGCVVCESRAVLDELAVGAAARGVRVRRMGGRPRASGAVGAARAAWRIGRFLASGVRGRIAAPARPDPVAIRRPAALLRTWPVETSFGTDGSFRDPYFPGLCEWLEERGIATLTIPLTHALGRSARAVWRRLRGTRRHFLAPGSFYRASDYLFALREAGRAARMPRGRVRLDGLDAGRLFDEQRRAAAFDTGTLEVLLSHRLPMRLRRAGLQFDLVIDAYENMIPEKPFILGMRRYMPGARLVGFQHGSLYPLFICNFVTAGESEFAPLPDRVVCNGELFRDILVREGLPAERAVVGPALRYTHLWEPPATVAAEAAGALVLLPLIADARAELLIKAADALGDVERLRVMVKPHPASSPEDVLASASLRELPPSFEFVSGGMGEWLAQARVVLGVGSSSIHEALAAGVPVLVVGRQASLDLNPLAWHPNLGRVFSDAAEIRAETLRLLALSEQDLAAYRRQAQEVLRECFAPVNEDKMRAFVEGLVELPEAALSARESP